MCVARPIGCTHLDRRQDSIQTAWCTLTMLPKRNHTSNAKQTNKQTQTKRQQWRESVANTVSRRSQHFYFYLFLFLFLCLSNVECRMLAPKQSVREIEPLVDCCTDDVRRHLPRSHPQSIVAANFCEPPQHVRRNTLLGLRREAHATAESANNTLTNPDSFC